MGSQVPWTHPPSHHHPPHPLIYNIRDITETFLKNQSTSGAGLVWLQSSIREHSVLNFQIGSYFLKYEICDLGQFS